MKRIISIIVTLVILLPNLAFAQNSAYISSCWACTSETYLDDITLFISEKDEKSMSQYLASGKCQLVQGKVSVSERGIFTSKVIKNGTPLYVVSECIR